jgi:hypothetical protein
LVRPHRLQALIGALALVAACVGRAVAADDTTPPTGTVRVIHDDRAGGIVRLGVPASDDLSGVAEVRVSSQGDTWATYPYAATIDWLAFEPTAGGSPDLGRRMIRVQWRDGAGNWSAEATTTLDLLSHVAIEYPLPAVTGQPFTLRPIYAPGAVPGSTDFCSWELRWGNDRALRDNIPNETFGSLYLYGEASRGFCDEWTLTLPWVPVRQFQLAFSSGAEGTGDWWEVMPRFHPSVGSDDRRIRTSSLPMVQVLPDRYSIIVGQPVTYRAYPVGGAVLRSDDVWHAYWPGAGVYKMQRGGSTFTFAPPVSGTWLIAWNGGDRPYQISASYDPPARYPDLYRPNTTAPVQRVGGGMLGPTVPVTISWTGSDRGWGIDRYQLQRSTDGGAWKSVALPSARATSILQSLAGGHSYRFRVRAVDRYGNLGYWDYGPTFRPRVYEEWSAAIVYRGSWARVPDASASGGYLRETMAAGGTATLRFSGRDVAWIAERGPAHGRVRVYVDGVYVKMIDLSALADQPRRVVFARHWGASGTHTLLLRSEGTTGRPVADLDALVVLR